MMVLSLNETVQTTTRFMGLLPGSYRFMVQTPTVTKEYVFEVQANQQVSTLLDWRLETSLEHDEWLGFRYSALHDNELQADMVAPFQRTWLGR